MPFAGRPQGVGLAGLALAALALGCGHDAAAPARRPAPTSAAGRPAAPADSVRVIRGWSDTLRGGDAAGAARYFAVPSLVQIQPGSPAYRITERAQAVAFQQILPCGARLLSTERQGRYVNALFRLTMRPGATCDAPGHTARTRFLIRAGKIAEWRRAPDQPGDGRGDSAGGGPAV